MSFCQNRNVTRCTTLSASEKSEEAAFFLRRFFFLLALSITSTQLAHHVIDAASQSGLWSELTQGHAVVSSSDHGGIVVRQLPEDCSADRFESFVQADIAVFQAHAVDNNLNLLLKTKYNLFNLKSKQEKKNTKNLINNS